MMPIHTQNNNPHVKKKKIIHREKTPHTHKSLQHMYKKLWHIKKKKKKKNAWLISI